MSLNVIIELFLDGIKIATVGSRPSLKGRSIHFSFMTALTILLCRTLGAVIDTPLVFASGAGSLFNLSHIG